MQNKTKKNWLDVQVVIAAIAMTATLGLWNIFARNDNLATVATTNRQNLTSASSASTTRSSSSTSTSSQSTSGTRILLGGSAPSTSSPLTVTRSSRP